MTAEPFFTVDENARRQIRQLEAPLILEPRTLYQDTEFVVPLLRFAPTDVGAALYAPHGLVGISFNNCVIRTDALTWDPAWATDPKLRMLAGLRLDAPTGLSIDGLHIEGFPECGISATRVDTAKFVRTSVTRCFMGASFAWDGSANRNLKVDGFRAWDTWGPGPGVLPGIGGSASRRRAGGWSGAPGFAGYFEDALLQGIDLSGELYGFKLVRSKRCCVVDLSSPTLSIQGTQEIDGNDDGTSDGSESITVRRFLIDKRRGQSDAAQSADAIQISDHVHGLDCEVGSVLGGPGIDGHGIQLWRDVAATFRGVVISGFNGMRGDSPAYALEYGDGSSVNADFETANRFDDQLRRVRSA